MLFSPGLQRSSSTKLQRAMNAAARILTGTRKFDRGLTQLMHDNLHWLDVPERVKYKVFILTRHCPMGTIPWYLAASSGFRYGTEMSSTLYHHHNRLPCSINK